MSKIFSTAESAVGITPASKPAETPPSAPPSSTSVSTTTATDNVAGGGQTQEPVDVGAVLSKMASEKGGGGNYQSSIVDLLKLLDLDSSLNARKELAQELNVHIGADGSAEENIALHQAVMRKLAENGGKVPDSMKA